MRFTLLLSAFFLLYLPLSAQSVVRGPYMQSPTHNSIKVMWRTDIPSYSTVWYGLSPSALTSSVVVNGSVTDHIVTITGLQPETQYYYAVGDNFSILAGQSTNHYFRTHPVPGTSVPTRVWAIGDFGKGGSGQVDVKSSYVVYPQSAETDVWIWLGDNAYDDGKDSEYQDKVFNLTGFSDIFSWLPFYPSPGNHDYGEVWSESTTLGIPYTNIPLQDHEGPYYDIVEVPQYGEAGGEPSNLEVFYSFDYGDVHFLSLNSEVFDYTFSYDGINQMKNWIIQDLQNNTRKFTIAYFHQPPYSKGSHDSDDAYELVMKAMREKIVPTLEQFDIDLVVCGHSHVYERSYLIKGHYGSSSSYDPNTMLMDGSNGNFAQGNAYMKDSSYTTPEGTVYVVCGNGGSTDSGPALNHPIMAFADGGSGVYGSFIIDIKKNRLDGKYLKPNGTIADEFTILKKDMAPVAILNQTICEGDSVVVGAMYTGGSDSISYSWFPGSLTDSAVVLNPPVSTAYTVTITDNYTGQTVTSSFQVVVNAMAVPVVSEVIPGTLGSSVGGAGYTYQWYVNGNPVSGANAQYYTPAFSGNYSVVVTSPEGCVRQSSEFTFTISTTGIEDQNTAENIVLYPNPTDHVLNVVIPGAAENKIYDYSLINMSGKVLKQGRIVAENTIIPLDELEAGVYFMVFRHQAHLINLPFTKK